MKGRYRVIVQDKRIRYDFEICRNITIIRGDSATGKTTLIDMIRDYSVNGVNSSVELQCEKNCTVLDDLRWQAQLSEIHDSLIFIDEANQFAATKEFAEAIQKTDNYYILVTRRNLATLPYSVTEIYGIHDAGKYGDLKQTYNEMYRIYGDLRENRELY